MEEKQTKYSHKKYNINNPEHTEGIKKLLKDHIRIYEKHYKLLTYGTIVRYINNNTGNLLYGCTIIKHITKRDGSNLILFGKGKVKWFVKYSNATIFISDQRIKDNTRREKDNLYKLYKAGLIKIMDDNYEYNTELTEDID